MIITIIKWLDASSQRGPLSKDEFIKGKILLTCGILVDEDNETISLAQDCCERDDEYREVVHVPKIYILERQDMTANKMGKTNKVKKNKAPRKKPTPKGKLKGGKAYVKVN